MASQIVQLLDTRFPVVISDTNYRQVKSFCVSFETRDTHPYALNTAYLGLYKIQFTKNDRNTYFEIFYGKSQNTTIHHIEQTIDISKFKPYINNPTASEISISLKDVDAIDETRKIQSDVFNIFTVYLLHKVHTSSLNQNIKTDYIVTLLKILQYKFFTSLVGQRFKYGANEEIMRSTIDNLSNKFAIVQYGSWKKLIETRAIEFYSKDSVHYKTIVQGSDDKALLYLITDLQTRLRNQINIITSKYYEAKDSADTIRSYSLTGKDLDGEKILIDQKSVFDTITDNLVREMYVLTDLIDNELITLVCRLYPNITSNTFKLVLRKLSIKIVEQSKVKNTEKGIDEIRKSGDIEIYIGLRAYIRNLIQHTYRFCILNRININNKLAILKAIKDVYSSSRISNKDILSVKESTAILVDSCGVSKRTATLASLRLAVITYLIIKSFKYI
jgi:hypothetical protein